MGKTNANAATPEPSLTPMMKQYLSIKETVPDTLLFYRLGDFYELFLEDAEKAARQGLAVLGVAVELDHLEQVQQALDRRGQFGAGRDLVSYYRGRGLRSGAVFHHDDDGARQRLDRRS